MSTSFECTQIIKARPADVYAAFVDPERLAAYWLDHASAPLAVGHAVEWTFRVPGARETTIATALEPGERIAWRWADGTTVDVRLATNDDSCVVRLAIELRDGAPAALANAVEGFTVVLCDLKLLLETGKSPGLVSEKARLIAMTKPS
jgi:uncharacterized protein YndB with AHSA1/START domain